MTTIYDQEGRSIAGTIITAGPCVVTQIKTLEKDGYTAVQLGYGDKKEKNTSKPLIKHFAKAHTTPKYKLVEFREFDKDSVMNMPLGKAIHIEDIFTEGEYVDAIGISKGKGFQGVVKRHGFSGVGGRSHGQHNRERAPGSVGGSSLPSRVFKGMRMAGRTGGRRVKISNLKILQIIPEKTILALSGSIPGAKNSYILLEK